MDTNTLEYKRAFEDYMRRGTPIKLSRKQARPTTHYIWRTRGDGKVRPSHAANDGKIFAWDIPPETGHPGEDYGCRCVAEPYYPDETEFFNFTFHDVVDEGPAWTYREFIRHYFLGQGRAVTMRETGHLVNVVAEYQRIVFDDPKRLPGQIADEARKYIDQNFTYKFGTTYPMRHVVYSLGDTTIEGFFNGKCKNNRGMLEINGTCVFYLKDIFRDPTSIEETQQRIGKLVEYVLEAIRNGLEKLEDIQSYVADKIGHVHQGLRDYIYRRAMREIRRRIGKSMPHYSQKAYPELPGATPYDMVDQWRATISAKVYYDQKRSSYTV